MKFSTFQFIALFTCLLSYNSLAVAEDTNNFNIGIGTYALTVSYDDYYSSRPDDNFDGIALTASYAFANFFSIRGNFYSLDHEYLSNIDIEGTELTLLFGMGLERNGLRAYGGPGIFDEDRKSSNSSENYSGIQLNGGIGYSWQHIALDLFVTIRDPSDYETASIYNYEETIVVTAFFSVAAKF